MKIQCDKHGCKELLCGCATHLLENDDYISKAIVEKDKWIEELLQEIEELKRNK